MQPGIVSDRIASAGPLSQIPVKQHNADAQQARKESKPSGLCYTLRCGPHLRGGPRSVVWPESVPLVGYPRTIFGSVSGSAVLSRQLRRGLRPCRHALLLLLVVSAASAHRLRSPLPIPSMPRLSCGLPGILPCPRTMCARPTLPLYAKRRDGHGSFSFRSANRPSAAGLGIGSCSAPLVCGHGGRNRNRNGKGNGNGKWKREMEGERTEETGNATGKGKGKPSVPRGPRAIYIRCSAQKIHIGKWKIENRK